MLEDLAAPRPLRTVPADVSTGIGAGRLQCLAWSVDMPELQNLECLVRLLPIPESAFIGRLGQAWNQASVDIAPRALRGVQRREDAG